ncbi:MAG: SPOR domain-containing protein [Helicobacteraceae bacterium]|jgi:cell division septation protein DedD|nr:SPOR domain-containing protein [Helicobacteraceae bacterium]
MADNDQNRLNDILIKQDEGATTRIKNLFLLSAALFLIIVIALLLYRIIDGTIPQGENLQTTPDPTASTQSSFIDQATPPIVRDEQPRSALDEIIARHREQRQGGSEQNITVVAPKIETTPTPPAVKPPLSTPEPPQSLATGSATPAAPPRITESATPVTPRTTEVKPVAPLAGAFYVQIESLTTAPKEEYLKILRDRGGYSISVKATEVNGKKVYRLYVGPYRTRDAAAAVLPNIKRDYNAAAFIVRE